jgi:hypothetical protein
MRCACAARDCDPGPGIWSLRCRRRCSARRRPRNDRDALMASAPLGTDPKPRLPRMCAWVRAAVTPGGVRSAKGNADEARRLCQHIVTIMHRSARRGGCSPLVLSRAAGLDGGVRNLLLSESQAHWSYRDVALAHRAPKRIVLHPEGMFSAFGSPEGAKRECGSFRARSMDVHRRLFDWGISQ